MPDVRTKWGIGPSGAIWIENVETGGVRVYADPSIPDDYWAPIMRANYDAYVEVKDLERAKKLRGW